MKNIKIALLAMLCILSLGLNAQKPPFFTEGFETGSKPAGWSEEYANGNEPWRYRKGGHSPNDNNWTIPAWQTDITRNPPYAHTGTYNAIFFKQSTNNERTKLITKVIDMSEKIIPELSFWLCQVPWTFAGNTNWDVLRVYYKTSFAGSWVLLAEYLDPIEDWTQFKINLPNKSATYYIAFEGQTNWGYGTCIDDISIVDKGEQARYISELNVTQADYTFIPSGSSNEPILRIGLKVFGNTGEAKLNSVALKSLNTNDNDISLNGVKLYQTPTTFFNTSTPVGVNSNFSNGYVNFNDLNLVLPNGQSYLWVTYDVKSTAMHGNLLDAMIELGGIQVGDSLYPKINESPIGERVIYETIYSQNFDGTHGWTLSGEFEVDSPKGKGGLVIGYPDPTAAYSGSKVLGTDLNGLGSTEGDYENSVSESQSYKAISPSVNALFYKDLKVNYRRYLNVEVWDKAYVDVNKNNSSTWSNVWFNNNYFTDQLWTKTSHDIPSAVSRSNNLKFRFVLGPTDVGTTYSGWNIDDFIVTGDYITKDVGVVSLVYPLSGCGHSATDSVIVKIANLGAEDSPSNFPVQYSFNNGTTWVTNYVNQTIPAGDTIEYKFATKVNLTSPGIKNFKARTRLTGDEDASNDGISSQIYIVPTYTAPYTENFESNDGYWRAFGTSLWQWGTSGKASISGGSKSWITNLTQTYGDVLTGAIDTIAFEDFENATGWTLNGEFQIAKPTFLSDTIPYFTYNGLKCLGSDLTRLGTYKGMYENATNVDAISPFFNVANYTNLKLIYYKWHKVAAGDTAKIQASSNGTNWKTIWTNSGLAITEDIWTEESLNIPDSLANGGSIKFRFVIISNSDGVVAEGLNFDDMVLTGKLFTNDFAYLQSPCFNFTGINKPILDLSVFNHTETEVDGASLQYSIDNGNTWNYIENTDSHDDYWNWYTDSTVSAIGKDGWTGIDTQWRGSKHLLPAAIANKNNVIFRLAFKADKANNNFGGIGVDNFKLYNAPHDVGVNAITSPSTTCNLSNQETINLQIKNFGVRDMLAGDSITVQVNVVHPEFTDSQTDKIILSSNLAAGGSISHPITKKFDFSLSGQYDIEAKTTIETDPLFYSGTDNDVKTKTVIVQKPDVNLGDDIYTLNPTSVILDATSTGTVTYQWFKAPDFVTVIAISPSLAVTDPNGGTYVVKVTNTIPCTSIDTVTVHRLIRDVGVLSFSSPISSCELSDQTPFEVYIKNFGTDTLETGSTIDISYIFNGNPRKDSTWTMDRNLLPNDSLLFTFNKTLNLQAVGAYNLKAWAKVSLDELTTNDTTSKTIDVWGYPAFDLKTAMGLPKDSVTVLNPTYIVDAGAGWNAYLWLNDNSTNQTYTMANTGWAKVTVFDIHSCPATDSIYVDLSFADVSVSEVINPVTACAISGTVYPQIKIKNAGTNTIPSGTNIQLKYYLNSVLKESPVLTLSADLLPNATRNVVFGTGVNISAVGTYNFDFVATFPSDSKSSNDSIRHTVNVFGYPAISLPDSVFTRNSYYTIDAGSGRDSYSWSTGETTQQITVNQTNKYKVTVVENGMCSSQDSVVVTFLKHNYTINQIINPVTSCSTPALQSVTLRYSNIGNDTLKVGQQVVFGYAIDDEFFAEKTHTLTSALKPGQFMLYTFSEQLDLSTPKTRYIEAYGKYNEDINSTDDTIMVTFDIKASPIVNLGADRVIRTENITLDGGEGTGYNYLWQDNSTNRFFIVENTGNYWVTTTAPNGCFDRDTVTITALKPDLRVSSIISPSSACILSSTQQVQVEIENVGTDTIFIGQTINVSYEINDVLQQTQGITLTQKFFPGQKLTHTFTKTSDMSGVGTYIIKSYTTYSGDLNPFNNTATKTVITLGIPTVDIGPDRGVCSGSSLTLDAGNLGATYLWSTSATTQTINVNSAGTYSVQVTDGYGCSNTGAVTIHVNSLPTVTHAPLDDVCFSEPAFNLTGGNPSGGDYSGSGVTSNTFTASAAGAGTHSLTYTYTDGNGCSNSTPVSITVQPKLNVDLGADRSITAPEVLDAGAGFTSYKWQDNSTDQTYTVVTSGLYHVTVTDANGCEGYDEVNITFLETSDIIVSNLVSPVTGCYQSTPTPITFEINNRGTKTFISGEKINLRYRIGSSAYVTEELTFTSNFAQNNTLQYTFSNGVNLSSGDFTFTCYTIINGEKGDSTDYNVTIHPLPVFSFASDTIRVSASNINGYVINSGVNYPSYNWNTGATSPNITINQHGKYWLRVTDANNCSASDTVVVWWPVSTEIISGIDATIKLFPNPVKDKLNILIESEKAYSYTIEVMNPQGILVHKQKTLPSNSISDTIGMEDLTPGIYLIKVSNEKGSAVFKIIVTKN